MILHLIDVSSHLHVGSVNESKFFEGPIQNLPSGFKMPIIRTGGISFLFNKIFEFGREDVVIFACDRTPTNRLLIDENYKSGRPNKPEVNTQKALVEIILEDCGFEVAYEDGFEADDVIYTLANKYKMDSDIDHIFIHTDDSDIFINVDDKVSILPSSSRGKNVTRSNFEYTARKNELTPFNTLTFIKMLSGDSSDKIKALPASLRDEIRYFFSQKPILQQRVHIPNVVGNVIEKQFPQAYKNFQLVYPHISSYDTVDLFRIIDRNRTAYWGKVVGNANFKSAKVVPQIDQMIQEFFDRGYAND